METGTGDFWWIPDLKGDDGWSQVQRQRQELTDIIVFKNGEIEIRWSTTKKLLDNKKLLDFQLPHKCGSQMHDDIDDLTNLSEINGAGDILHHVRRRFEKDVIYTNVGPVLIAVNPFKMLNIYDTYSKENVEVARPHIFATVCNVYNQLTNNSQSVLASGESGAGKTESTKHFLSYLIKEAADGNTTSHITHLIEMSNILLEAMGNAKTVLNNNSSRFDKWVRVFFNHERRIVGAEIIKYLLEKSRVTSHSLMERTYHIFYQLIRGAPPEVKELLQLDEVMDFQCLSQDGDERNTRIHGIDDGNDACNFNKFQDALEAFEFNEGDKHELFRILACILHLGNINFCQIDECTPRSGCVEY